MPSRTGSASGILLLCIGVLCLSVNDAIAKLLTSTYAPVQILFVRNAIALPFAAVIALSMGGASALRSHRPAAHLFRAVLWICAATLFFTGLSHLGLAEATALVFVAPVFITALSAIIAKEQVGWRRWTAVFTGLMGVLVIVRPGGEAFQAASIYPIATALLYAMLMFSARWVDPRETVWTMMLYLVGAGAVLSGAVCIFFWTTIRPEDTWLFVGIAAFGTAGMTMITQAFRMAPASLLAPFDYTALLWATVLGYLIWNDIPDLPTYLGAAIIILSGLYIIFRERRVEVAG